MPDKDTTNAPTGATISATMMKAVELARRGGLVRMSGGYWIAAEDYSGPTKRGARPDAEWVGTTTVKALENRGVLVAAPGTGPASSRRRVLTSDGEAQP